MTEVDVHWGDCLEILPTLPTANFDLAYVDPPFGTQRQHRLSPRDRSQEYSFDDRWKSLTEYGDFLLSRLRLIHPAMAPTGSIFFHCDKTASHVARLLLDEVFGASNFRAEIIWYYKRWSNSARNLLPAHQTILFYSKTNTYKFNTILTDYSPTTNVDQILQRRRRDASKKSVYDRDEHGEVVCNGPKQGVPLSDVWEIPFLNPKANERTGYPTQKPILLLQRIIEIASDPGDAVLDPFCGSGTTLVAAQMIGRHAVGIDASKEAVALTRQRVQQPIKTESKLLLHGRESYHNADETALAVLNGIPHVPVHRNQGITAFLKATFHGVPIPLRVQKPGEPLFRAVDALYKAAKTKNAQRMILVATEDVPERLPDAAVPKPVFIVHSTGLSIIRLLAKFREEDQNDAEYERATDSTASRPRRQRTRLSTVD